MKLYLTQHGEAKREEEDPERPLTEKGREDIERVAELLRKRGIQVKRILHTDKKRAIQTAQILARYLEPPKTEATDALGPLDDTSVWEKRLRHLDEDLMLVGHMPYLGKLSSRLLSGNERLQIGFEPGSVLCLERDASGAWSLRWMLTPEII